MIHYFVFTWNFFFPFGPVRAIRAFSAGLVKMIFFHNNVNVCLNLTEFKYFSTNCNYIFRLFCMCDQAGISIISESCWNASQLLLTSFRSTANLWPFLKATVWKKALNLMCSAGTPPSKKLWTLTLKDGLHLQVMDECLETSYWNVLFYSALLIGMVMPDWFCRS